MPPALCERGFHTKGERTVLSVRGEKAEGRLTWNAFYGSRRVTELYLRRNPFLSVMLFDR